MQRSTGGNMYRACSRSQVVMISAPNRPQYVVVAIGDDFGPQYFEPQVWWLWWRFGGQVVDKSYDQSAQCFESISTFK